METAHVKTRKKEKEKHKKMLQSVTGPVLRKMVPYSGPVFGAAFVSGMTEKSHRHDKKKNEANSQN